MYITVVVKVGFFVGNVGCVLTSETDTPVCQEERTLYVYDPFTFTAVGSQLIIFLSVNHICLLLSVCFHAMYSVYLIMLYRCTKQCIFIEKLSIT